MAESHIKIASYKNLAFERAWSGRSAGMWGVSAVGLGFGALVGTIAPLFPMVAGFDIPAGETILKSMAIFGATGMAAGFSTGVAMGISSGAAAAVTEERERRDRAREQALGITSPELEARIEAQLAPEPDARTGWQKFKDGIATYINPKVGAVMTLIGAAGGAVMAAAYFALKSPASAALPGMETLLGSAAMADPAAVTAYFVGVMGVCFGGLWTFNFPRIATQAQEFAGGLTGGRLLGTQWGPPAKEKEIQPEIASIPEPSCACPSKKFASFQDMLATRKQAETIDIQPRI